jgi:hypothetical protein
MFLIKKRDCHKLIFSILFTILTQLAFSQKIVVEEYDDEKILFIYQDSLLIKEIAFGIIDYLDSWYYEDNKLHIIKYYIPSTGTLNELPLVYVYSLYEINQDTVSLIQDLSFSTRHIYDKNKLERLTIDVNILFLKNYDEVIDKIELYPFDKEKIDKWFRTIRKR